MLFEIPTVEQSLIAATSCQISAFPPRGQDSDYTSPPRLPQVPFREENYADTHKIPEALNNQLSSSPDTHWRRSPTPLIPQGEQSPDSSTSPSRQGSTTCLAEAETPQNPLTSLSRDAKWSVLTYLESAWLCARGCSGFWRTIGPACSLWESYRWPR